MKTILDKIIDEKKREVSKAKDLVSLKELSQQVKTHIPVRRSFSASIQSEKKIKIIGELKIASPSKGYLHKNLDLINTAKVYEKAGICAISVLTDKHFQGKLSDITQVKKAVNLPVLRKDFIIDEYQLYETYLSGADAILIICSILNKNTLAQMIKLLKSFNMDALVEIHNEDDLNKINFDEVDIIGINNRNLNDFTVNLETTKNLCGKIPNNKIIVSESGITSRSQIRYLQKLGINAALIGEGIVTAKDIPAKIKNLTGRR